MDPLPASSGVVPSPRKRFLPQGDVGAGGHRERPGDGRRGSGDQDGHRVPEGAEEPADRAQDLDQAVVQPEQEVPDPLRVDLALGQAGHHLVLVLEFVLEDLPDRPAQGPLFVGLPHREILSHPVDLDGLQHQMHRPRAEDPADPDEEPELETAPQIEGADFDSEELLPEGEMLRLNPDQLVQNPAEVSRRNVPERLVEGQVEELIQDEPQRQRAIVPVAHARTFSFLPPMGNSPFRCP